MKSVTSTKLLVLQDVQKSSRGYFCNSYVLPTSTSSPHQTRAVWSPV